MINSFQAPNLDVFYTKNYWFFAMSMMIISPQDTIIVPAINNSFELSLNHITIIFLYFLRLVAFFLVLSPNSCSQILISSQKWLFDCLTMLMHRCAERTWRLEPICLMHNTSVMLVYFELCIFVLPDYHRRQMPIKYKVMTSHEINNERKKVFLVKQLKSCFEQA